MSFPDSFQQRRLAYPVETVENVAYAGVELKVDVSEDVLLYEVVAVYSRSGCSGSGRSAASTAGWGGSGTPFTLVARSIGGSTRAAAGTARGTRDDGEVDVVQIQLLFHLDTGVEACLPRGRLEFRGRQDWSWHGKQIGELGKGGRINDEACRVAFSPVGAAVYTSSFS